MLKYTSNTVFNSGCQTLVNTVNCVGIMGAGLALEFKLRFPAMYKDYVNRCRRQEIKVGKVSFYQSDNLPYVLNFPTKNHWKYQSQLSWIEQGLVDFVNHYRAWGIISIAFPKLGCDRGGLNWQQVQPLLEKYLGNLSDLEIYICLDEDKEAQGIEGQMVELINQVDPWLKLLKLPSETVDSLPIYRFRDLLNCPEITKEIYEKIFRFLYPLAQHQCLYKSSPHLIIKNDNYLHPNLFAIADNRLRLIMLLATSLNLKANQISKLTWGNFLNLSGHKILTIPQEKSWLISDNLWQQIQITRVNLEDNYPLITQISKGREDKPLSPQTIQQLLKKGKKILNYGQQLSLNLN